MHPALGAIYLIPVSLPVCAYRLRKIQNQLSQTIANGKNNNAQGVMDESVSKMRCSLTQNVTHTWVRFTSPAACSHPACTHQHHPRAPPSSSATAPFVAARATPDAEIHPPPLRAPLFSISLSLFLLLLNVSSHPLHKLWSHFYCAPARQGAEGEDFPPVPVGIIISHPLPRCGGKTTPSDRFAYVHLSLSLSLCVRFWLSTYIKFSGCVLWRRD